LAPCHL